MLKDAKTLERARELARQKYLYDKNDMALVSPVAPKEDIQEHFRILEKSDFSLLNVHGGELHDKRAQDLTTILTSYDHWRLGTTVWDERKKAWEFSHLVDLDYYRWQSETVRVATKEKHIRHDVYGQSNRLSMSKFHPWVAIEVIDTHYPSGETFDIFIKMTENLPFIIAFDFAEFENYFFRKDKYDGKYLRVISAMYMQSGLVWYGGKSRRINDAGAFERFAKENLNRVRESAAKHHQTAGVRS